MADSGYGTTLTFDTGFFAEIQDVGLDGMARDAIETTHMETTNGARTFIASDLFDNGEVGVEMSYDPQESPPIDQPAETLTITAPNGATIAGTAFMTANSMAIPMGDRMTQSVTLKWSGEITITPAA